jgi:tetratricopeptide (TPR) repeat protein
LDSGQAVAFLGAGVSAPLYPLWKTLVAELIEAARDDLSVQAFNTCQAMANKNPDAVVELIRRHLGSASFREVLRQVFRVRRDSTTGRTWTSVQELVARCGFNGVVTTNYDPGIVNARMAVRPFASGTGFASWTDEDTLERWRTGEVFQDDELPVLFAHGHHNQPGAIVLATTEYRRAYSGKLSLVLKTLADRYHLVWIGFSFSDQRIAAVLREVEENTGTRFEPGRPPRHVAILPWDPSPNGINSGEPDDPDVIRNIMEIQYGCRTVFYPVLDGDHSALTSLLEEFAQPQFPAAAKAPATPDRMPDRVPKRSRQQDHRDEEVGASHDVVVRWVHGGVPLDHFTGREEELSRLDRWAADRDVRLIGVTAWGGAGKTALVTEWLSRQHQSRPVRGIFGWSFYEDPSAERWANELLEWAGRSFNYNPDPGRRRLSARVLDLIRREPLLLVLDGLETLQEAPARQGFGQFLDGLLRSVLTGSCQRDHAGLAVLTSRFPFADLEAFDGASARMLDVPPFSLAEGAELLRKAGGDWLSDQERRSFVHDVDGHALAVNALATTLRERPPASDLARLREDLASARRTDARVGRVLQFYAERLTVPDRLLVAVVSLFTRPISVASVVALGEISTLDHPFAEWTSTHVETVARGPLAGLLTWHPAGLISAHPLVRETFRTLVLTGDAARLATDVALADLPVQPVVSYDEALRVVEMIELLLEADQWDAADRLHIEYASGGRIWPRLPAARIGQRCATAFIGTEERRRLCREYLSAYHVDRYLNWASLCAMLAGDMIEAESLLRISLDDEFQENDPTNRGYALQKLSGCLSYLGHAAQAREAATKATDLARYTNYNTGLRNALTTLGAALDLEGETAAADRRFAEADQVQVQHGSTSHVYSLGGTLWGDFLLRTGRLAIARQLTEKNLTICERNNWNNGIARCCRLLARCDLAEGNLLTARQWLDQATSTFRDGDFLVELALTLPDVAEYHLLAGNLDDAEHLCTETVTLAGPRQLVPSHARALALRARVRSESHVAAGDISELDRARDDADHALRLTTKIRHLPWQELDALKAHSYIDRIAGLDQGWHQQVIELRTTLIPSNLEGNPLAAILDPLEPRNPLGFSYDVDADVPELP